MKSRSGLVVAFAVAALFGLMACAWSAMFYFAGLAHVESVPLAVPTAAPAQHPEAR